MDSFTVTPRAALHSESPEAESEFLFTNNACQSCGDWIRTKALSLFLCFSLPSDLIRTFCNLVVNELNFWSQANILRSLQKLVKQ